MKNLLKLYLFSMLMLQINICKAQSVKLPADQVKKVSDFENFYESGDFFFGGQPTLEALSYAKESGVKTLINLRSDDENKEFTKLAFSEEKVVTDLGIKYVSIAMKGKEAFTPKTLNEFTEVVEKAEGKVYVHCKTGGRVTLVMMAYLIKHKNYTLERAETFGQQLTYFNYLNALLE